MKKSLRHQTTVFALLLGCLSLLMSCSSQDLSTEDSTNSQVLTFQSYCQSMQLTRCEAKPEEAEISAKDWQLGIVVIQEILRSPSSIKLLRADFNRSSVVHLLETFGVTNLISFLNQVPWSSLQTQPDGVTLINDSSNQELVINNLRIIAAQKVVIKLERDGSFSVSGLSLGSKSEKAKEVTQNVKKIDLSQVGALNISTDSGVINKFPISFFSVSGLIKQKQVAASETFRALSSFALDTGFNWREKATLIFTNSNLTRVFKKLSETIQLDGSLGSTLDQIVKNSQSFIFGGTPDQVVTVSLASPLHCDMKFVNIPILGNKIIGLDFARGIGLSNLSPLPSGDLAARIYGIKTDFGAVSQAQINGNELRIKVGPITIPLTFQEQSKTNGIRLESIACK